VKQAKLPQQDKLSRRQILHIQYLLLSGLLLVGLAIPILEGGDGFALFRFYQPLWPLLILPLYFLVAAIDFDYYKARKYRYVALTAALALVFFSNTPNWVSFQHNNRLAFEFEIARAGRVEGQTLNQIFEGDNPPSVGVITAGGIALTYAGEIIDLMGLNNLEMAHSQGERTGIAGHTAFDTAIFYQLEPELILPRVIPAGKTLSFEGYESYSFTNKVLKGLLYDERFQKKYTPAIVHSGKEQSGAILFAFFENEFLMTVQRKNANIKRVNRPVFE